MKSTLFAFTCASSLTAFAYGQQMETRLPMTTNARQLQSPMAFPPAPIPGSDSCTTPDIITGPGPHAFDTTGMTTGPDGQSTVNCIFFSLIGIDSDVWFEWTAPATGTFELTTCQQTTVDTKIAVYGATGCPLAGGSAAGCADDLNSATFPGNFQTRVVFSATAGQQMTIQVGGYPGTPPFTTDPPAAQGAGTFTIQQQIVQDPFIRHDGTTENSSRVGGTAATTLWMAAIGDATTGLRSVTAVSTAFGSTPAGSNGVTNGNPTELGVWEDPNDDGNPNDAVLLSTFSGIVANEGTDTLNVYTLPVPVVVDKVFFVGAAYNHGAGVGFPVPLDVSGCAARAGQNWMVGNAATTVDMTTLSANSTPPFNPGAGATVGFLLEAVSGPATTGTAYCFGDGTGTACPCANSGAVGNGCANGINPNGANLSATGNPSIAGDTLLLSAAGVTNGPGLYFQGTVQLNAGNGNPFGDGLRCVGGTIIRLGIVTGVANASSYPSPNPPAVNAIPISVKGLNAAGNVRNYQLWYRDSTAGFCTASVFNLTNGLNLTWVP